MATKKFTKKKIQDAENSGFGKYEEGNGGGTPIGGVYGGGHGRGIWKKAGSPGHRDAQPRTKDGKFTYNSVNGKTITTGESRGKTVNPLLTGGVNGVKIEDVEKQFSEKSGAYWDKYKKNWYKKGGEFALGDAKTHVAAEAIWETAKKAYDVEKGEFKGESKVFDEIKKGKKTAEEKTAAQKAQKTGEEQAVIDKATDAIKIKPGTIEVQKTVKAQKPYKKKEVIAPIQPSPVMPAQPTVSAQSAQTQSASAQSVPSTPVETKTFGTGKYTMDEANAVKKYLKETLGDAYDTMFDDDTVLEEFIDAQGGKDIFKK